uniref:Uncharacterized protein n=1 Tax=Hubei reo-like virus 6 TaxID=1923181 RepID=A0A1L3KPC0_9VIRU|nr:hypothetical protein 3 [Hubei reo-like virus 6]
MLLVGMLESAVELAKTPSVDGIIRNNVYSVIFGDKIENYINDSTIYHQRLIKYIDQARSNKFQNTKKTHQDILNRNVAYLKQRETNSKKPRDMPLFQNKNKHVAPRNRLDSNVNGFNNTVTPGFIEDIIELKSNGETTAAINAFFHIKFTLYSRTRALVVAKTSKNPSLDVSNTAFNELQELVSNTLILPQLTNIVSTLDMKFGMIDIDQICLWKLLKDGIARHTPGALNLYTVEPMPPTLVLPPFVRDLIGIIPTYNMIDPTTGMLNHDITYVKHMFRTIVPFSIVVASHMINEVLKEPSKYTLILGPDETIIPEYLDAISALKTTNSIIDGIEFMTCVGLYHRLAGRGNKIHIGAVMTVLPQKDIIALMKDDSVTDIREVLCYTTNGSMSKLMLPSLIKSEYELAYAPYPSLYPRANTLSFFRVDLFLKIRHGLSGSTGMYTIGIIGSKGGYKSYYTSAIVGYLNAMLDKVVNKAELVLNEFSDIDDVTEAYKFIAMKRIFGGLDTVLEAISVNSDGVNSKGKANQIKKKTIPNPKGSDSVISVTKAKSKKSGALTNQKFIDNITLETVSELTVNGKKSQPSTNVNKDIIGTHTQQKIDPLHIQPSNTIYAEAKRIVSAQPSLYEINYDTLVRRRMNGVLVGKIDSDAYGKWLNIKPEDRNIITTWSEFDGFQRQEYPGCNLIENLATKIFKDVIEQHTREGLDLAYNITNINEYISDINNYYVLSSSVKAMFFLQFNAAITKLMGSQSDNSYNAFIQWVQSLRDLPKLLFVELHSQNEIALLAAQVSYTLCVPYDTHYAVAIRNRDTSSVVVQLLLSEFYNERIETFSNNPISVMELLVTVIGSL